MKATKCRWQERRGKDWSQTVYEGLRFHQPTRTYPTLVPDLSHGLRPVEITDVSYYKFHDVPDSEVEVSDEFVADALAMLAADKRLQRHINEYRRLMQGS